MDYLKIPIGSQLRFEFRNIIVIAEVKEVRRMQTEFSSPAMHKDVVGSYIDFTTGHVIQVTIMKNGVRQEDLSTIEQFKKHLRNY
jgi:hypothetical protein